MKIRVVLAMMVAVSGSEVGAEGEPSISRWLREGYTIVEIVNAGDREMGLREVYLQKEDDIVICHLSTAKTYVGGEGVELRECFIVDVG